GKILYTNNGGSSGISLISGLVPEAYSLSQNYPNPFNPSTNFRFDIPSSAIVTLKVYDSSGKEVRTLLNEVKTAGSYEAEFDALNLPSGIYYYTLMTGDLVLTKKMMLVK
ncbi:MAG: T9SS type A sorting domain-containing protein, partial [Ignavibacteria bacterium]